MTPADEHRQMAAKAEQDKAESWERSDTDGFLSQWASGLTASLQLRDRIRQVGITTALTEAQRWLPSRSCSASGTPGCTVRWMQQHGLDHLWYHHT